MNPEAIHYDRNCLQALLDDTLSEPLAGDVAEHVADCEACRRQLESLAARPEWWSHTCEGVKEILADPAAYSSAGDDGLAGSWGSSSDLSFANDFAVDFLEPSQDSTMLGRLAEYEIIEVIGRGGMGIVLKGYQKELHRYVAIKALAPHLALSAAARRRFEREAQATAAVVNPHVVAIHAVAAQAKLPYLVMPFLACESLQQRLDRHGPLDVKDILRIGLQAARGLAAAHAQGLVHRDVKPGNILLEITVDRVLLTDFGLARAVDDATLTRTGIIAGTPQYMSPEQAKGDPVDHRSDLFSLGSVLYAMCTGRAPFRAETTFGVLYRIREAAPRPIREINPDIPEWLERIVFRLLAKAPADRIGSAEEVAAMLERCLARLQQPTATDLRDVVNENLRQPELITKSPAHSPDDRRRLFERLVVAVLVVVTAAGMGLLWRLSPQEEGQDAGGSGDVAISAVEAHLPWDATQSQLNDTTRTIEQLEADAKQDLDRIEESPATERREPVQTNQK